MVSWFSAERIDRDISRNIWVTVEIIAGFIARGVVGFDGVDVTVVEGGAP